MAALVESIKIWFIHCPLILASEVDTFLAKTLLRLTIFRQNSVKNTAPILSDNTEPPCIIAEILERRKIGTTMSVSSCMTYDTTKDR